MLEENSMMYKLEREIALRKVELDHQLEMRKQDLLEKELNLKAREMELKFIENDNLSKQRRVEEKKIDLQLRNWVEEENAQLDLHDYEPIYIKTSIYEAKIRQLSEIFEKIKKHCEIYDIDPTKYFYYDDLQKMVYEAKFVLEMNKSEENDKFDGLLEYEWDENSRDLLESLKDSEFFSYKFPANSRLTTNREFFLRFIPEKLQEFPKYYGGGGGNYGLLITKLQFFEEFLRILWWTFIFFYLKCNQLNSLYLKV